MANLMTLNEPTTNGVEMQQGSEEEEPALFCEQAYAHMELVRALPCGVLEALINGLQGHGNLAPSSDQGRYRRQGSHEAIQFSAQGL